LARREDVVKVRRSWGKRPFEEANLEVWPALEQLVDPLTRGDPESPLRWTCKSTHVLSAELFERRGRAGRRARLPRRRRWQAIPYGIYDVASNAGFVSVGIDHDTPVFAVKSIEAWWKQVGQERYPNARELFITADAGGSNGYRWHVWKQQLQRLADMLNLAIHVSHFPPGTSKWNKVEHRLFSFIAA
jgi:hypothetical protein